MDTVDIVEAEAKLSLLVDSMDGGEELLIVRHGHPVAKLVRLENRPAERYPNRGLGIDRGRFEVPDDFDDPLPPEILRHFT
ncbi:MAG TPA: type II toxin-antitoxin system prevent-host-death family antitoxin [Candidatus Elarobacter sp.]|nr:type II toxin-antitoxin system prevent-host-death family antitoxin [Candidatus Elarobacter sp.]